MVDPVSVIVAAIAVGAAAGGQKTIEAAIADAYAGLKAVIQRKFGSVDVEPVERKPESSAKRESLSEDLAEVGAGQDQEVVDAARKVIEAARASSSQVPGSIGVDLERVHAEFIRIADVEGGETGVRGRDWTVSEGVDISGIRPHTTRDDSNP